MKVLVLGVGTVGRVIIRDLIEYGGVDGILAVDIDKASLEALSRELDDPRLEVERGDVRNIDEIARLMRRCDIAINATWYEYNLHAIIAAMKAGRDLADLGGLYWMTRRELDMDEDARRSGITVLIGVGNDPGTSNILAALAASKMDEVEEIHIRWASHSETDKNIFGFSIQTIVDEASLPAVLYLNGKYVEAPPLSYPEITYFPEPIGYKRTYAIIHSELATLPSTISGVKTVTYKDSWDEYSINAMEIIKSLGLNRGDAIQINDTDISPKEFLARLVKPMEQRDVVGCLKVEARGYIDGLRGRIIYYLGPQGYHTKWGVGVTAYTTGVGAAIGLRMLYEGYAPRRGVIPPELLENRMYWINELKRRGIRIIEERVVESSI